jgi:hypothetical protein
MSEPKDTNNTLEVQELALLMSATQLACQKDDESDD